MATKAETTATLFGFVGRKEIHAKKKIWVGHVRAQAKGDAHYQNRTDDLIITSDTLYH
jgi:hypothetical protein